MRSIALSWLAWKKSGLPLRRRPIAPGCCGTAAGSYLNVGTCPAWAKADVAAQDNNANVVASKVKRINRSRVLCQACCGARPASSLRRLRSRNTATAPIRPTTPVVRKALCIVPSAPRIALTSNGEENWPKMDQVIAKIERARQEGLRITADMYTYRAGATGLDAAMPHRGITD